MDNPKADGMADNPDDSTIMFDQSFGAQEDAQVPSQSDNSASNMAQLSMASRATQVETSFEQETTAEKSAFQCENPEVGLGEKEHILSSTGSRVQTPLLNCPSSLASLSAHLRSSSDTTTSHP